MYTEEIQGLFQFLKSSPTAFHAVDSACRTLSGFTPLKECEKWNLVPGGKYYVTRNRSSIIAFTLPEGDFDSFRMVASHSDSPTFKIKENAEISVRDHYIQLDVERYGGMIFSTWFDRPLSLAGRVILRDAQGLHTRLVDLGRPAVMIPNVAIHMNREVNSGYKYNAAVDMMPLWSDFAGKGSFRDKIAEACGAKVEDIVGSDLFLYNPMEGCQWGVNGEFISAPRLDDLECVYSSLQAVRDLTPRGHVNLCCIFDNEEVGSGTKQGADSTFLSDVLMRAAAALGAADAQARAAIAASFMVSADNAHAVHPNHPEKYDAGNRVFMNEGVVIKHNANQKYTTDGVSAAIFSGICADAGVAVQHFANRSDVPGGSTLGHISNAHASMNTVDIGLAQLAMHSCYETAGTQDLDSMIRALRRFYETEISMDGDGAFVVQ